MEWGEWIGFGVAAAAIYLFAYRRGLDAGQMASYRIVARLCGSLSSRIRDVSVYTSDKQRIRNQTTMDICKHVTFTIAGFVLKMKGHEAHDQIWDDFQKQGGVR